MSDKATTTPFRIFESRWRRVIGTMSTNITYPTKSRRIRQSTKKGKTRLKEKRLERHARREAAVRAAEEEEEKRRLENMATASARVDEKRETSVNRTASHTDKKIEKRSSHCRTTRSPKGRVDDVETSENKEGEKEARRKPQKTFHIRKSDIVSADCFACGKKGLLRSEFSNTQLLRPETLRRCRKCVVRAKKDGHGDTSETPRDPRLWQKQAVERWLLDLNFSAAQTSALLAIAPHGYQLLDLSGKTLKNKVRGFRSADGPAAVDDRKRLQDCIHKLRETIIK